MSRPGADFQAQTAEFLRHQRAGPGLAVTQFGMLVQVVTDLDHPWRHLLRGPGDVGVGLGPKPLGRKQRGPEHGAAADRGGPEVRQTNHGYPGERRP